MKTVLTDATGVSTVVAVEDGNLVTGTVQDCTPILEHAKGLHNAGLHGSSEMRLAAKLPMVLVETYCNERGITFKDFMADRSHIRHMLNDPALQGFRVWGGRV